MRGGDGVEREKKQGKWAWIVERRRGGDQVREREMVRGMEKQTRQMERCSEGYIAGRLNVREKESTDG